MDKKTVLLASACTLLMISCSNDAELINVAETTGLQTKAFVGEADFQIVDYAGDKCIQFKNDSVFNAMLWEMNDMSEEERNNIFSGAGFVSQWQLMQEADQEQELIVDNYEKDLSQPWPAHQIKEFKQKYDDVFMFEPYDSTDFIAHYKLKGSTYSSFVNRRGVFLIGDSVAHAPVYKALEEYFGSGISLYGNNEATNEKNDINLAESKYQIPGGDYVKVRAIPRFIELQTIENKNYLSLGFDYLSQKKKVLWKKHRTMIILRFTASGSGSGFEVYNVSIKNYQNKNGVTILLHTDVYNKLLAKDQGGMLGHVGENPRNSVTIVTPPRFEFSGRMEIWSDEMPESNKGTAKISLKEDW